MISSGPPSVAVETRKPGEATVAGPRPALRVLDPAARVRGVHGLDQLVAHSGEPRVVGRRLREPGRDRPRRAERLLRVVGDRAVEEERLVEALPAPPRPPAR